MATSSARKPLPALAFLLALSLLTALVWWRVLHRSDSAKASTPSSSCSSSVAPTPTVSAVPAPAGVTVTVLNSTDKTGLAAQVSGFLATDGFKTGKPDNDTTTRYPVAGVGEIRYGPAGAAGAKLLTFYVPGATLVPDATKTDAAIDLAVGAKYTAVVSTADVVKALAAAKLSQLPPPPSPTAPAASSSPPASSASTKPTTSGSAASSSASKSC
jgi:hypothetical protein